MHVYVRNQDGAALMPCTPAKARKLLQAGKAKIVEHRPFTIQLLWRCEGYVQLVGCGIDKGSSTTGIACVGNGQVLLAAEIHHRQDVKDKMQDRRDRRKSRRARCMGISASTAGKSMSVWKRIISFFENTVGRIA
jgi:hypothetical protein